MEDYKSQIDRSSSLDLSGAAPFFQGYLGNHDIVAPDNLSVRPVSSRISSTQNPLEETYVVDHSKRTRSSSGVRTLLSNFSHGLLKWVVRWDARTG